VKNIKFILLIQVVTILVTGIFNLFTFFLDKPFLFLIYIIMSGIIFICNLIVIYIIVPIEDKIIS
jgi:hypothetical protein